MRVTAEHGGLDAVSRAAAQRVLADAQEQLRIARAPLTAAEGQLARAVDRAARIDVLQALDGEARAGRLDPGRVQAFAEGLVPDMAPTTIAATGQRAHEDVARYGQAHAEAVRVTAVPVQLATARVAAATEFARSVTPVPRVDGAALSAARLAGQGRDDGWGR